MIGIELWKLVKQEPFTPFTIRMADGRSFLIDHPGAGASFFEGDEVRSFNYDFTGEIKMSIACEIRGPFPQQAA